jgi:hypothetical protein
VFLLKEMEAYKHLQQSQIAVKTNTVLRRVQAKTSLIKRTPIQTWTVEETVWTAETVEVAGTAETAGTVERAGAAKTVEMERVVSTAKAATIIKAVKIKRVKNHTKIGTTRRRRKK